ncbi:MAG: hypothetical protein ACQEXV_22445 [Bacillota bacterium]
MKFNNEIRRAIEQQHQIYINTLYGHYTGIAAYAADPTRLRLVTNGEIVWIPLHEITHVSTVLTFKPIKKGCS